MNQIIGGTTIRLHQDDNVVVAAQNIAAGATIPGEGVVTASAVPSGHKIATRAIPAGDFVRKYNQIIGIATADVAPGQHVHVQNCAMSEFERDYAFCADMRPTDYFTGKDRATFQGIVREDGRVATRNYIGVLTTVNCSATVAKRVAAAFENGGLEDYPNVDGVVALVHGTGCGMATKGEGFDVLQRVLWGYLQHPNFAGVLLIGLGCEAAQIRFLLEAYGIKATDTFQYMTIQSTGGTRATIEEGVKRIKAMLPKANQVKRETVSAEHLSLALQCGGSDGYSGITANPALGAAADLLVRHGGTAILAETPEVYGAEHLLTRRAVSRPVGERLIDRIRWWESYTASHGGSMDNNPSPGNKEGGLTTILEKSLGAVAKGGTSPMTGVYEYAEPVTERGFVFMDSPGYDPCSVTGQVASGANIVCFTTGRGSVFGCRPVPSLKLASNSEMYRSMSEDMDVNCG